MSDCQNVEQEIALINQIIEEAIDHGGDCGGPYHSNGDQLKEAIEKWLACKGLDDKYVVGVRELDFCDEELRYVNKPWSRSRNNNYLIIMKVDEVQYGP